MSPLRIFYVCFRGMPRHTGGMSRSVMRMKLLQPQIPVYILL
nr:MAG TPA: exosome complex component [Caudoviricetes sp.]